MAHMDRMISRLVLALLVPVASVASAVAEEFYAGKQINLIVGAGVGGGYDLQARLTARHLGKHIPGHPTIIVQNMPAAGGIQATNHIYSGAPKDGTMIALVQRGMLLAKLTYPQSVRFEIDKLNWIGSLNSEVAVTVSWHTSPHKSARDLFDTELIVGGHPRRRSGDDAEALQFVAWHEVQGRHWLQQHGSDRARH